MSHYITVPINANGVIDPDEQIEHILRTAMSPGFGSEDVFIYSHGWWTTADAALKEYNVATTDFVFALRQQGTKFGQPPINPFLIGLHWPSMLVDDPKSWLDKAEALSFYTMEKRADDIGEEGLYAVLRLLFLAAPQDKPVRINLFGHSFGCKVVCAALDKLAGNEVAIPAKVSFNVVLLQAAFATNCLDAGGSYDKVIPTYGADMRMLITHSSKDAALGTAFPAAHAINFFASAASKTALGFTGPPSSTTTAFPSTQTVSVAWGSKFVGVTAAPSSETTLVSADLTPPHSDARNTFDGGLSGHHSDIFRPEVYDLMSWFLFA